MPVESFLHVFTWETNPFTFWCSFMGITGDQELSSASLDSVVKSYHTVSEPWELAWLWGPLWYTIRAFMECILCLSRRQDDMFFSASRLISCKILLFFQFLTYFHAFLLWILLCFSHCFREGESFDSVISICELSTPWIYLWEGLQKPQTYCWLLMGHFLRLKQENNRWVQLKILLHPEGQNGDNKFDICTGSSYACGIIYDFWLLCKQRVLLSLVGTPIKSGQQIKECLHALRLSQSRCSYKGDTTRLKAVPWQLISQKGGPHRDFNPHSIPRSRVFGETCRGYNRMQDVGSRVRRPQMEAFNHFFFFFYIKLPTLGWKDG